jgi:hypothetical protein
VNISLILLNRGRAGAARSAYLVDSHNQLARSTWSCHGEQHRRGFLANSSRLNTRPERASGASQTTARRLHPGDVEGTRRPTGAYGPMHRWCCEGELSFGEDTMRPGRAPATRITHPAWLDARWIARLPGLRPSACGPGRVLIQVASRHALEAFDGF